MNSPHINDLLGSLFRTKHLDDVGNNTGVGIYLPLAFFCRVGGIHRS